MNQRPSSIKSLIPFQDLTSDLAPFREELDQAISKVVSSGIYFFGPELRSFEEEFASYHEANHAIGVASGLAALKLMLQAHDIGFGDEVIVPGNTYIATWLAVSQVGAKPVPVDPDFRTRNIDPTVLKGVLTVHTKAVLAVHLYGSPCDMDALQTFCSAHGLFLLIDAAQSCGAKWRGKRANCIGDAAAFSFYPTKNMGAFGDAGAVVINDSNRADRIRLLRNYGMRDRYHHLYKGDNAKLEEIHAAVLRVKLKYLDQVLDKKAQTVERYRHYLSDSPQMSLQQILCEGSPAWHLFSLTLTHRDHVLTLLEKEGIQALVHYPVPPHLSSAYTSEDEIWPSLPITEKLSQTSISLPLFPSLKIKQIEYISKTLLRIVQDFDE